MTAQTGAWTERMLLVWEVRGSQPAGEDETVAIEPDGTTWLWVRVPADPGRGDVVGSFRTRSSSERLEQARDVIARLSVAPNERATGGHRGTVLVAGSGVARQLPMRGADGVAAEAIRLGRELATAAFAEPLAAVRIAARLVPVPDLASIPGLDPTLLPDLLRPGGVGPAGLLSVVVHGLGVEAAGLVLAADALQAHWRSGERSVDWTELPSPDVGLTGDGFHDGLRAPARIPPGTSAAISVRATIPDLSADSVAVRVAGKVQLVGPWESVGVPTDPFEAHSRYVAIETPID